MAITAQMRVPQGALTVVTKGTGSEKVNQALAMAVYNVPTPLLKATSAGEFAVYRQTAQSVRATQAYIMAVARGRTDNPKLISWTFTLDGHDMYVLKLGTGGKTLVLDLSTEQWSWFSSGVDISMRTLIGMNWRSSGSIPAVYGSNIVCGDDTVGVLWIMDPDKGLDDLPDGSGVYTFPREATGQIPIRGRTSVPIYSAYLTASLGDPALTLNTITLEYSDDQGHTYITADQPTASVANNYAQEFVWRSLGQVRAPGRLFRLSDDGAFSRIDSLDVNEGM